MGCVLAKKAKHTSGYEDPTILASETSWRETNLLEDFGHQVTVNEVEALYELFKKLSCSIFKVGYIHKEEFQLALLRNSQRHNFFADRIFDLFDINHNGVIEFGEFVRSLNVFHPNTSEAEKIAFAFKLYDLRQVGYIKREELKEMVLAILNELELSLSDDVVETIVDQTFIQADLNQDGKIDTEEWKEYIAQNPSLIKKMTLPYLKDITMAFPSFIVNSKVENIEMNI